MEEIVIQPSHRLSLNLKELWQYRELIYIFAWREIKIKYKQAILGILWVILQPLMMMLLISFFLSDIIKPSYTSMPYYLYVFIGLVIWNLFSNAVNLSVNQILANANIIKKIYFPRLIIPLSSILVALFDFIVSLFILIVLISIQDIYLWAKFHFFYFLVGLIIAILFAFSLGTFLSALVVKYRDFKYILPFIIQVLFFASPVMYDIQHKVPHNYQWIVYLNPLNVSIDLFRAAFESDSHFQWMALLYQMFFLLIFFLVSVYLFRKTEEYIADVI